jgi:hypothetical protein
MQLAYYCIIATPSPLTNATDYYLLRPLFDLFSPRYDSTSFVLRDRLGGGNFGVVYEAVMKRSTHHHSEYCGSISNPVQVTENMMALMIFRALQLGLLYVLFLFVAVQLHANHLKEV